MRTIHEPEPWRELGQCLLCKDRFPKLAELVIILIQDGMKLIDWEEEEDWAQGINNASGAEAIVKALNVGGSFLVNISSSNVIVEHC